VNGPGIGQFVHVIAPSGASIDARVRDAKPPARSRPASFLLRLEEGEENPLELLADADVSIEFTNERGVCRILGTGQAEGGETALRVNATGTVELIQRRDYVRVEAFVPVAYQPDGPDGWTATANTLDVSGGGFRIAVAEGLRLGDMLRFTLELGEGEEPLHAVAAAVRESGEGEFGMRFLEVLEIDRQRLIRWVFARERLARQIARHP
jgi:c-di-GMP-binding flagellar brake protein YcgR